MKIVFAPSTQVKACEAVGRPFLRDVLDLTWDEAFLTDKSLLSDFSIGDLDCDVELKRKVKEVYDVELESTRITLVDLFSMLRREKH